jgi:ABC-2 type transport system permease protein
MTWVELKLFVREPLTVVFVLVLPIVVLYVLNGVFGGTPDPTVWEGLPPNEFYVSAYIALVAATAGVLSLPVHLAGYREQGVLRRFRASAVRPAVLVAAHVTVTVVVATVGALLVMVVSALAYDTPLPRRWWEVAAGFLLVAVAFGGLGGLLGVMFRTARAAQGLGVLLFFVFMMLGGAGPPREVLPAAMVRISDALPVTYAAAVLRQPWVGRDSDVGAAAVVLGLLVLCLVLLGWRLRLEDRS